MNEIFVVEIFNATNHLEKENIFWLEETWRPAGEMLGAACPNPHEQETPWGIHKYCEPPRKITLKRPFGQWRHLTTTTILPEFFRFLLSWAIWGFCYLILTGITKFEHERKTKWILVLVLERPHRNWVPVCLILSALKKPDSLIFLQVP